MRRDEAVKELRELPLRKAALDSLRLRIAAADTALEALGREDRLLLEMSFIQPKTGNLDRLCEIFGLEKSRIYERKNAALRRFALAFQGDAGAEF